MTDAELELRSLLDRFPDAALDLHSALVGNVLHGGRANGLDRLGIPVDVPGGDCGCAIGTVAESRGMLYRDVAPDSYPMEHLPALEYYVQGIRPDGIRPDLNARRRRVIRWVEKWMRDREATNEA